MFESAQLPYRITVADITSDKLPLPISIVSSIAEIILFEKLDQPFVTGKILIQDDNNLMDGISFRGTESLHLEIESTISSATKPRIRKDFIINNIEQMNTEGERRRVYTLGLIEKHYYLNSLKQVSKSYTGTPIEIIESICKDYLKKPFAALLTTRSRPVQERMTVCIPYLKPLEAMGWINDRATSFIGCPYFLHTSLYHDVMVMDDLHNLLTQPAMNVERPFSMNQQMFVIAPGVSPEEIQFYDNLGFQIGDINVKDYSNALTMQELGGIGSGISNVDLNTGRMTQAHFSIREQLRRMYQNNLLTKEQNVFDPLHVVRTPADNTNGIVAENLIPDELEGISFDTVNSSNTYLDNDGYYDDNGIHKLRKRLESLALKVAFQKNMISAEIPGDVFFSTGAGTGQKITCNFQAASFTPDADSIKDVNLSGDYIIYANRLIFNTNGISTDVMMSKYEADVPLSNVS